MANFNTILNCANTNLAPSSSGTLTNTTFGGIANFTGTFEVGGNAMSFPPSAAALASLTTADQTVSGGANLTSYNLGTFSSSATIDCGD